MLGSNDSKCWNWGGDQKFEDDYVKFAEPLIPKLEAKTDLYIMTPPSVYKDYTKGQSKCKYQDKVDIDSKAIDSATKSSLDIILLCYTIM